MNEPQEPHKVILYQLPNELIVNSLARLLSTLKTSWKERLQREKEERERKKMRRCEEEEKEEAPQEGGEEVL